MSFELRAAIHKGRALRRFRSTVELRAGEGAGPPVIVGHAATWEDYTVEDMFGEFTERVDPGAFDKTLSDGADVRYFYDHEGLVMARTKSGTLTLSTDDVGLSYEAEVDTRQTVANDLVIAIERGDVDQSSFAFQSVREEWDGDFTDRTLLEVKLFDVSSVAFPANEGTDSGLRVAEWIDLLRRMSPEQIRAELREGKVLSAANVSKISDAIASLQSVLDSATDADESKSRRDEAPTITDDEVAQLLREHAFYGVRPS